MACYTVAFVKQQRHTHTPSVTLAQWAAENKFTIVGTMRQDRKGILNEVKQLQGRDEKSTMYVYDENENMMLVSYVDKTKSGGKNVIVLTTMHDVVKVTRDQRRKPQVLTMYEHTKGGVDVVDLLSSNATTRIKSKRWPVNALVFLLDTVRTNAKTTLKDHWIIMSNFDFTCQLGKMLILLNIQ